MSGMYIRVWEYHVDAGRIDAFRTVYGPRGDWSQLFRHGHGYAGTQLYADTDEATRFITVDRWSSEAAWTGFLDQYGERYQALDARTTRLSLSQRELIAGTV